MSAENPLAASGSNYPPSDADDPAADPDAVARTIALRRLAVSARSRSELQSALNSRKVPADAARRVLDRFQEAGLIDDQQLAKDWVESRQTRRNLSRSALRRELQAKGLAREEIDVALEGVGREQELRAARALAAKKLSTMAAQPREVQRRRIAGALGRRGFDSDIVGRVLADLLDG